MVLDLFVRDQSDKAGIVGREAWVGIPASIDAGFNSLQQSSFVSGARIIGQARHTGVANLAN